MLKRFVVRYRLGNVDPDDFSLGEKKHVIVFTEAGVYPPSR